MSKEEQKKHLVKALKVAGVIYAGVAGLYFVQAARAGMNPSLSTALEWPYWFAKTPSPFLQVLAEGKLLNTPAASA